MKETIVSFAQTFVATFLTSFAVLLSNLPEATWSNPETYKIGFWSGLIVAAVRSALKVVWQKTLPVSVGGVPRD